MDDGKNIVKLLQKSLRIMSSGDFSEYDLKFIKLSLEEMLEATNKTIKTSYGKTNA